MSRLPELRQEILAYQHGFVPARIMQLSQPHPMFVPDPGGRGRPLLGRARGTAETSNWPPTRGKSGSPC